MRYLFFRFFRRPCVCGVWIDQKQSLERGETRRNVVTITRTSYFYKELSRCHHLFTLLRVHKKLNYPV